MVMKTDVRYAARSFIATMGRLIVADIRMSALATSWRTAAGPTISDQESV